MLTALGKWAQQWAARTDPWTNVYGLARSMLAGATALTLICNRPGTLFRPGAGVPEAPICDGARHVGLFCLSPSHLSIARFAAVAILLVVASGYRPRVTALLHWWVSYSLQANAILLDGGDQVTEVLTLLLLPVALTDGRKWHWEPARNLPCQGAEEVKRIVALSALWIIRLQVAGIYFHAAIAKFAVPDWANGTILYYVLTSPMFGAPPWLIGVIRPVLLNGVAVTLLTWSVLILEYLLSAGLLIDRRHRGILLVLGILLHLGILIVHGLVSFATVMFAALILYLRPVDRAFRVGPIASTGPRAYASLIGGEP